MNFLSGKKGLGWFCVFAAVFLLSQDFLFCRWPPSSGLLGLPGWLWWFVFVHVVFIAVFYLFTKYFWREP